MNRIIPGSPVTEGHVQSESRDGRHKVNLADYVVGGVPNGSCTCENFENEKIKNLRETRKVDDQKTRCKHIRQYREWLCNAVIAKIGNPDERSPW